MKQLKSSLGDLRRLFAGTVTLRTIAEPLISFDATHPAEEVLLFMRRREFDVVGLREGGVVTGYVTTNDLTTGEAGARIRRFDPGELLSEGDPLLQAFEALRSRRHLFIQLLGQPGGIITRGDLQKAPVRLWLFGLVSLLEMQLLRVIRQRHPGKGWEPHLPAARLQATRRVFQERRRRNEENDLSDCLQLADKATLLMKDGVLFAISGFASKRAAETFFKEVGTLRNALAHANDILAGRWPALADLVTRLEDLLERLEKASPDPARSERF
ncbi:MAG TPA: hypothetical protein DCM86_18720 [Verrucomicrobiales bacterium]|nr:hypothetical protein [Verrucomicrobiales bacterium]